MNTKAHKVPEKECRHTMNETLPSAVRKLIVRIQDALSLDLLSKMYRKLVDPCSHPTCGHCYIAAEAFFHLYGKEAGYKPYYFHFSDGRTHWWLKHIESGQIADPTEPQVVKPFDYGQGKRHGFRHPSPCLRTKELMRRVQAANERK